MKEMIEKRMAGERGRERRENKRNNTSLKESGNTDREREREKKLSE